MAFIQFKQSIQRLIEGKVFQLNDKFDRKINPDLVRKRNFARNKMNIKMHTPWAAHTSFCDKATVQLRW